MHVKPGYDRHRGLLYSSGITTTRESLAPSGGGPGSCHLCGTSERLRRLSADARSGTISGRIVDEPAASASPWRGGRAISKGDAARGMRDWWLGSGLRPLRDGRRSHDHPNSARCCRSASLARDHARLSRRTSAPQQGAALSRRPADCRGDRRRDASCQRRPPRLQVARADRRALAQRAAHPGSARARRARPRPRRGSLLVRNGKGGRRREIGMDTRG
jgi:hypothetical protein